MLINYDHFIDVYCELHKNEIGICTSYWERDSLFPNLRTLTDILKVRFPLVGVRTISVTQESPKNSKTFFLKLLANLCPEIKCARTVFLTFSELVWYSQPQESFIKSLNSSKTQTDPYHIGHTPEGRVYIQLDKTVKISYGFTLPKGTIGYLVASESELADFKVASNFAFLATSASHFESNQGGFIQWNVHYSGWYYCYVQLWAYATRTSPHSSSTEALVTDILALMSNMFSGDPALTDYLEKHLEGECLKHGQRHISLLPMLFMILKQSDLAKEPPVNLFTSCLKCIHGFAKTKPKEVWTQLRRSGLFDERTSKNIATFRYILNSVECQIGHYPITLSLLDLLQPLLKYIQAPMIYQTEDFLNLDFGPCLSYLRTDIFSVYGMRI